MKQKSLLFALLLSTTVFTLSCNNGNDSIKRYVFIDDSYTLHTDPECQGIYKVEGGELLIIQIESINDSNLGKICSRCVSEKQLKYLIKAANNHEDI